MAERLRGRAGVAQRKRRLDAEPLCRMCKAQGIVTRSVVPDHIVPLSKGGTDDDTNIRCLCKPHHDEVTRAEFGWKPKPPIGLDGWPTER